jgi:nitrilase
VATTRGTPFTVAVVQASPVFLKREETTARACELIISAGRAGAQVIAFPEAFIPGYPDWVWAVPAGEEGILGELYGELLDQAVEVPGETTEALGRAAKQAGACVVIGINERNVGGSRSSLYNTLLYIAPDGRGLGKHRKLVPTGGERLIWAQGPSSAEFDFGEPTWHSAVSTLRSERGNAWRTAACWGCLRIPTMKC